MARTSLLEQICAMDNLTVAWRKVRANIAVARRARSCGVDEVSVATFEQNWEANLAELQRAMLDGSYQPLPARQVVIGKVGGGQRTIGVLAVRDRIAQRAAHQVLEPLFEQEFLDCSYGFRPGRSVDDAIHRVLCYRQAGCAWVFDADINACFASLEHGLLMRFVGRTVHEERVLDLIRAWLQAGLLEADAALQQGSGFWDRAVERGNELLERTIDRGMRSLLGMGPVGGYAAYEDEWAYAGELDPALARREALKRVGGDALLLGLALARPFAGRALPGVRRLTRKRGVVLSAAGALGLAAAAGVWWALRRPTMRGRGMLQGGALSPLLANVYLHQFDQAMIDREHNLVRYADDFAVCCPDEEAAQAAGQDAAHILAELRLTLNPAKTQVTSFEQGFRFLGQHFQGDGLAPSGGERARRELQAARRNLRNTLTRLRNKK